MNTINHGADQYNHFAAIEAAKLDGALADIRAAQDSGEFTVREAADARVAALELHLAALRKLRQDYLPNGD